MSYSFSAASSHVMTRTASTPAAATQFSVIAWIKPNDTALDKTIFSSYNATNTSDRFDLRCSSDESIRAVARTQTGSAENAAISSALVTAGAWSLAHGTFAASNSRRAGFNGGNFGSTSATITQTSSPNSVRIGLNGPGANGFDGLIALVAVYNVVLGDLALAELAVRAPRSASSAANLVALWDLRGNQGAATIVDPIGGYDLAISGATFNSDNPSLYSPRVSLLGVG